MKKIFDRQGSKVLKREYKRFSFLKTGPRDLRDEFFKMLLLVIQKYCAIVTKICANRDSDPGQMLGKHPS